MKKRDLQDIKNFVLCALEAYKEPDRCKECGQVPTIQFMARNLDGYSMGRRDTLKEILMLIEEEVKP